MTGGKALVLPCCFCVMIEQRDQDEDTTITITTSSFRMVRDTVCVDAGRSPFFSFFRERYPMLVVPLADCAFLNKHLISYRNVLHIIPIFPRLLLCDISYNDRFKGFSPIYSTRFVRSGELLSPLFLSL